MSAVNAPYAFLSSPVEGLEEVRHRIHDLALPNGNIVWVDEIDRQYLPDDHFEILDDLFGLIRKSSIFLVLLARQRYGTSLIISRQQAHASFWEAELFYAALTGRRIKIFLIDDEPHLQSEPEPRLRSLLQILQFALPQEDWAGPYSRQTVVSAVREYLLSAEHSSSGKGLRILPKLIEALFTHRGLDAVGGLAPEESLQFLGGYLYDETVKPNLGVAASILKSVQDLKDEERRLSRLWLAFRELSGSRIENIHDAEFLPYWNSFFGAWSSAGSWYGLHGHLHLGVLSALTTQARVRERMKRLRSSSWMEEVTKYPGGALASSRYSIARKVRPGKLKKLLLSAAIRDIDRELSEGSEDPANLYAIRGSIYRQNGRYAAAVEDYKDVLRRRRDAGASEAQIGEALSELGFGYLFCMRLLRGRELLEEGVKLLSQESRRIGFLARAKRKLAIAYALTGHPLKARREIEEARMLASRHGALDQIR